MEKVRGPSWLTWMCYHELAHVCLLVSGPLTLERRAPQARAQERRSAGTMRLRMSWAVF